MAHGLIPLRICELMIESQNRAGRKPFRQRDSLMPEQIQSMTVAELAQRVGAIVVGDGTAQVTSAHTLEEAEPGQISFVSNPKYEKLLATTRATAVITGPDSRSDRVTLLRHRDPYYAFMQAVVLLHGYRQHPHSGIHDGAHVDPSALIGT